VFANCIFCHADLGKNEAIEHFPVGRRIAFDAAKGRLWVVCRSCARWNLTPLDERWEAVEECERLFHDSRLRVSTDNIGLARIREGTELVRVGEPQRPEMAAWRYGDQFARRRRKYHLLVGGGVIAFAGLQWGVAGLGSMFVGYNWGWQALKAGYERATAIRVPARHGKGTVIVTNTIAKKSRLFVEPDTNEVALSIKSRHTLHRYVGADALAHASKLFPKVNLSGARRGEVDSALDVLERAGHRGAADLTGMLLRTYRTAFSRDAGLGKARPELRLALEMSLHEDAERAALEGELSDLEDRWREAEEIASISDSLFLPASVEAALARFRKRG
jgi:hypothetical protein